MEPMEEPRLPEPSRRTLVAALSVAAERFGEAHIDFDIGGRITYAELDEQSTRAAAGLAAIGVERGDRVLALVRNRLEFMVAMFGTLKLGAVWVPINTELKGSFLEHQLHNSDPRVVLVDSVLAAAFDGVAPVADAQLRAVIRIDDFEPDDSGVAPASLPAPPPITFGGLVAGGYHELFDVGRASDQGIAAGSSPDGHIPELTIAPSDIACIMYTSGTTGPAKGVLMPHAHCVLFGAGLARALDLGPTDHYFICMPLFHANALLMQAVGCLLAGASAHVVERFSPKRWLDDVRRVGATHSNLLGVMPEFIWNTEPTDHDHVHQLQAIMATPVGKEWAEGFVARFGVDLIQGFGMTECNIPFYTDVHDPPLPGLAGRLLDDWFEARVVDPATDEPLSVGEVGELVVRPKVPSGFMAGYFRMPEKTVEAWRNLWFHTGDAARIDDDDRLFFVDRIKDCIRRRGENISAFEVEQVLNGHPSVAESIVVGVKVEGAGGEEEVKACLVLEPGADFDPTDVLDHCVEGMPRYAVPRFIDVVDHVPKTGTGKVQKQPFRNAGVGPTTWDRETAGYQVPRG